MCAGVSLPKAKALFPAPSLKRELSRKRLRFKAKENRNIMAKIETKLTFVELTKLKAGELYAFAKDCVKLTKAVTTAKDKFTENLKFSGKVVAAMKRRYTEMVNSKGIPADTSFKKYFEQNAGGVCPARVETLASLFNALVETGLLKEAHFDSAAVDWLEKANAIISAARKTHGDEWKGCDDVLDTINALSTPGDALKTLKDIRKRQKESEKPVAGDGTAAVETTPLTLGVAVEFIKAAFGAAAAANKDRQVELCNALFEMNDAWANNDLTNNRREALDKQVMEAKDAGIDAGIEIIRAPVAA